MTTKYTSKTRESVTWVHSTDGVETGRSYYKQAVYKRADGTEFINLKHPQEVTRIDGVPTVYRHAKTVKALSFQDILDRMKDSLKAGEAVGIVILPDKAK